MKINLISIGNSKGIRIPSSVIKQCGLGNELEMRVENGVIMLAPVRSVRAGALPLKKWRPSVMTRRWFPMSLKTTSMPRAGHGKAGSAI